MESPNACRDSFWLLDVLVVVVLPVERLLLLQVDGIERQAAALRHRGIGGRVRWVGSTTHPNAALFRGSAAAASPAADDDSNDGGSVVFGIVFPDGMEARRSGFIRAVNSVRTVILRYTTVLLDGAGRVRGNVRAGKCGKNCKN